MGLMPYYYRTPASHLGPVYYSATALERGCLILDLKNSLNSRTGTKVLSFTTNLERMPSLKFLSATVLLAITFPLCVKAQELEFHEIRVYSA